MANWDKITSRGNVDDRRGQGNTAKYGGGIGILGLGLVLLVNYMNGGSVIDVLPEIQQQLQVAPQQNITASDFDGTDEYEVFSSTVLGSVNDMWANSFSKSNMEYLPPKLVLFRGGTPSACGGAYAESGPHYCPRDKTIYLDETFFDELQERFGAQGGDVAQAYVIAHEVAHHVQGTLNILNPAPSNQSSIKIELQADCFAGLWANSIKDLGVFESGEIVEALDAAAAVGDDRIQRSTTGRVNPESWTHGSSEQRVAAFTAGYENGTLESCSVFE